MTLPVTFTGTTGDDITAVGFTKYSGDTGQLILTAAGRARRITNSPVVEYLWTADTPSSADYDVSLDYTFLSNTRIERIGVIGRASDAARTFYMARISTPASGNSNVQLYKCVAGTFTQLGSNYSIASSGTYTITLSMSGTTIRALVDGVERISVTDSAISAAGKVGLYVSSDTQSASDSIGIHIDNFTASFASGGTEYDQVLSATVIRSATLDLIASFGQSMSASVTRTASLSAATIITKQLAAAISRVAAIVTQYTEGGGPIQSAIKRFKLLVNGVKSAIFSTIDDGD